MIDHLHGISTYQQLLDAGIGKEGIAARRQRVAIGLVAVAGRGWATSACGLRMQGYRIKVRPHHADIAVAHGTAVPEGLKWVRYRRSNHLGSMTPVEVDGLACVPAWWAFGDLAYDVVEPALAEAIAHAVGSNRITLDELEEGLGLRGKFPGRSRLRHVLEALRSDLPFSRTEMDAARRLRRAGLDVRLQHEVTVDGGRNYRLDLVVADLKINIEIDGPHHWLPAQAAMDRQRDRALRELDWVVERFSVYGIDKDPDAFVAAVLRLVQRRREALAGRRAT